MSAPGECRECCANFEPTDAWPLNCEKCRPTTYEVSVALTTKYKFTEAEIEREVVAALRRLRVVERVDAEAAMQEDAL